MNYERCSHLTQLMTPLLYHNYSSMKRAQCIILFWAYQIASAAGNLSNLEEVGLPGSSVSSITALKKKFISIVDILQNITAIIAILGICLVGILYIMSRGDEEKTAGAKKYMIHILIGVLIAFTAW